VKGGSREEYEIGWTEGRGEGSNIFGSMVNKDGDGAGSTEGFEDFSAVGASEGFDIFGSSVNKVDSTLFGRSVGPTEGFEDVLAVGTMVGVTLIDDTEGLRGSK